MKTDLPDIVDFQAVPWCLNGHFHTIGRSLLAGVDDPYHQRIEIPTPDNDFLDLDVMKAPSYRPVVVLFHGLEGSSKRYYITELAQAFAGKEYTVVAVNFRGCSGRLNRRRRFYHSGETQDIATVFRWINERFPEAPIGAVGFSLGGNALLKSLGELKSQHPLTVASAVSVPFDLALGARHISQGFNRVYEINFMRTLRDKLHQKRELYPDIPTFSGSTLYEFDDQVTAPLHGFDDADDYYQSCSAQRFVEYVRKPTLLIHSRSDPICPFDMVPFQKIESNASLHHIITEDGGHVGFWSKPRGWLNRTIVNFFEQKFDI